MSCDLHTHSTFSDGTSTPEELVSAAQELGLTAVALCDHNDVDGLPRFLAAARGGRPAAVPGTEISTVFEGTELHILGLFIPERGWEAVRELTARMRRSKEESNLTLERRLRAAGYALDYAVMRAANPDGYLNRAHFAAELTRLGYTSSIDDAFRTLLAPGAGFYEPPRLTDALEAVSLLREIGSVPVLAHPLLKLDAAGLRRFLPGASRAAERLRRLPCGGDGKGGPGLGAAARVPAPLPGGEGTAGEIGQLIIENIKGDEPP